MPKPQAQKPEEEVKQEALPPVEQPVEQPAEPGPDTAYIEVLHVYQGRRTNEQQILPGVYTVGDAKLYGLADYLVKNGHARLVTRTVNG